MSAGRASVAGKPQNNTHAKHHGASGHLRAPLPPVRDLRPALSTDAREILDRMRKEEDFYPDIDETLLILGY
jgi:hypothetical protein